MKLDKIPALASDSELRVLFAPFVDGEQEVDKDHLAPALLNSARWEEYLPRYLHALNDATHMGTCGKLFEKLLAATRMHANREQIDRVIQQHASMRLRSRVPFAGDALSGLSIDQLRTPLSQLTERAAFLRANDSQAAEQELALICAARGQQVIPKPPHIAPLVNATLCALPEQHCIIAALPKTLEEAARYFEAALGLGTTLFVSAHESTEAQQRVPLFWTNTALASMPFEGDLRIKLVGSHELSVDRVPTHDGTRRVVLVENTLRCSDGRLFTHIHYEGWVDRQACPSEPLLAYLLERMRQLVPNPQTPIAINCHAGIGRSGTIAVSYVLRRRIAAAAERGDEADINVAQTILEFRRYRRIVTNSCHYATIHSVLAPSESHP